MITNRDMTQTLNYRLLIGTGLSGLIIVAALLIVNSRYFVHHESILSSALTVDLTLLLPLTYFLFIRKTKVPKLTVLPVFILSLITASAIIPDHYQGTLDLVKFLLAPIELFVLGFIIFKTRRIIKGYKESQQSLPDFSETLRQVLRQELKYKTVADIFTSEISMFRYTFSGLNRTKESGDGTTFTYHKESGYLLIIAVLVFIMFVETFALHLALSRWNDVVAWVFTGLSIYGVFFLTGDAKAVLRRPVYIDKDYLHIRTGLRWYAQIPLAEIGSVELISSMPKEEGAVPLLLLGSPNILLRCTSPQTAIGYYGISRTFTSAGLAIDEYAAFKTLLEQEIQKAAAEQSQE